jgi:hypothetical protein
MGRLGLKCFTFSNGEFAKFNMNKSTLMPDCKEK